MAESARPRVGIWGLTGCAGDQLVLLNAERALPTLAQVVEIVEFPMAASGGNTGEPLDLVLVEGSVCSTGDRDTLLDLRERASVLMALGTCAVWGGIPAMVNTIPLAQLKEEVYGDAQALPDAQIAQPLSAYVSVDYALTGCPVEEHELLDALAALARGQEPRRTDYSVCSECRIAEQVCLVTTRQEVCCGPITAGGCRARCPAFAQPCHGCRGPVDDPALDATKELFANHGLTKAEVIESIRSFSAPAWVEQHLAPRYARDPQRRGLEAADPKEES